MLLYSASKNEIMPIIVTEITESGIMGRAGPAHIMIPQLKISSQNARYRPKENIFELFSQDSDETLIIRVGSKLYCRCFEMRVEMSNPFLIQTASCGSLAPFNTTSSNWQSNNHFNHDPFPCILLTNCNINHDQSFLDTSFR